MALNVLLLFKIYIRCFKSCYFFFVVEEVCYIIEENGVISVELVLMTYDDYPIIKSFYQDKDVMKMITGDVLSEQEMKEKWEIITSWNHDLKYGYYLGFDQDLLVGVGCLKPYSHGVEVGYMIYPRYWRQEYGKQICYELMKIVETMTVQRIVAYIDPLNIPSKKILESYGFQSIYQKGDEELLEKKKNRITGYTGLYGIVANPIRHSFSPMMHNTAFQTLGIDDVYLAFEVAENQLSDYITSVKTLNIKGFNVSMPYKLKIMDYLDDLTTEAKLCQAVNTVKNVNGKLIGHISDGKGFVMACEEREWHIQNQKIVVLGAGGAACAIIVEMALQGAKEIVVYNRSEKPFIKELNQKLNCDIHLKSLSNKDELKQDLKDAYLLVQTTNVGMSPNVDQCLIDESYLSHQVKVADIIYKPAQTKLLKMAERLGLEYMNGEGMILYQGAVSFEFWTGQKMPIKEVKIALGME